jgi:hypothetical protein
MRLPATAPATQEADVEGQVKQLVLDSAMGRQAQGNGTTTSRNWALARGMTAAAAAAARAAAARAAAAAGNLKTRMAESAAARAAAAAGGEDGMQGWQRYGAEGASDDDDGASSARDWE